MIGPRLLDQRDNIHDVLVHMHDTEKGRGVLGSLGFEQWQTVDDEMEFMIDLLDTLAM